MAKAKLFPLFFLILAITTLHTNAEFFVRKVPKNPTPLASKYRLPTNVIPVTYILEIQPLLDDDPADMVYGKRFTAPGKMIMIVDCIENSMDITFHAHTLEINSSSIVVKDVETSTEIHFSATTTYPAEQTYTLHLDAPGIKAGSKYSISIEYIAQIPSNRTDGLYRTSYKDADGNTRYLTSTDFEADDARRAWPLFDEPNLKAIWDISIIRKDPNYHSISNVPLSKTEPIDNMPGWVSDIYQTTPPLPSYLVAMTVSDYAAVTASPEYFDGRPVKIWGPPPMIAAGMGDYAANVSAQILDVFETYYNVESGLEKMDKVSLKDFSAGAMENWGMNTYRESRLLFLPGTSTIDDKVRMTSTLSHEIAHQWFGNLVTMKWWNHIWLNEGFASFVAAIGVNGVFPEYKALESLVFNAVQLSMQVDAIVETTHPLSNPTETEEEIGKMFSTITYSKGGSVLRMVNAFLTEEIFKKGLKAYLDVHRFGNTEQDDLFTSISTVPEVADKLPFNSTFKQVMETWTLQSGHPIVRVNYDVNSGMIQMHQEKFSFTGTDPEPGKSVWSIPITFYKKGEAFDTETKVWVTSSGPTETPVELGTGEWVLINPTQIGYYRVLYSQPLFDAISQQLQDGEGFTEIDELSRSGLIDDYLNLGFAGYYDLSLSLDLTKYMDRETEYIPFMTFLTNMGLPNRMLARSDKYFGFKNYILGLIKPRLTSLQLDPQESDRVIDVLLRSKLYEWACNMDDAECLTHAKEQFANWMANPETGNPIPPDQRASVYCTAVAHGGDAEWNFLISQYGIADVGSPSHYLPDTARINFLKGMGCSRQTYRLSQLLDFALAENSFILSGHRLTAIQAVAGNKIGSHLAFNFIRNHFETLERRFGIALISSTITTLSSHFNTHIELEDVSKFHTNYIDQFESVAETLETAKRNIRRNVNWMGRNFESFSNRLKTTL